MKRPYRIVALISLAISLVTAGVILAISDGPEGTLVWTLSPYVGFALIAWFAPKRLRQSVIVLVGTVLVCGSGFWVWYDLFLHPVNLGDGIILFLAIQWGICLVTGLVVALDRFYSPK